jgi:predicted Holliday junction resolvase-like endonuclease
MSIDGVIITIVLVSVFLFLGCLMGYLYANNKFQKKKEEMLKQIGDEKEKAQMELGQQKEELQKKSEHEVKMTLAGSRAGIKGRISENLVLLIPDFQKQHPDLKVSEAKFTGEPIDYLFFEGIENKNITKVVFLEVKAGRYAHLNETEISLKKVIDDAESKGANVVWREYRVPEPIEV